MNRDADVELYKDTNDNNVLDRGDDQLITSSTRSGTAEELISRILGAGTYYIRVYPYSTTGNINYTLTVSASQSLGSNQSVGLDFY
jgi:hypothetical protein